MFSVISGNGGRQEFTSTSQGSKETIKPDNTSRGPSVVYLTIFVFRGEPDVYYKRHVLIYFTRPEDSSFHETVHVQRDHETGPWEVKRFHGAEDWTIVPNYLSHVNAGTVLVQGGQEMLPVDIVADTPIQGREQDDGWTCLNFVLEGLERIAKRGLQTKEWFGSVAEELTDRLFDGAIP
jgi:hypothetical protein